MREGGEERKSGGGWGEKGGGEEDGEVRGREIDRDRNRKTEKQRAETETTSEQKDIPTVQDFKIRDPVHSSHSPFMNIKPEWRSLTLSTEEYHASVQVQLEQKVRSRKNSLAQVLGSSPFSRVRGWEGMEGQKVVRLLGLPSHVYQFQ